MRANYEEWLHEQQYDASTINAQLHRAKRVEDCYGDLDEHFEAGTLQEVIEELTYSAADERQRKPNPSKIPLASSANVRNNLASYKNAVVRYRKFLTGWERSDSPAPTSALPVASSHDSTRSPDEEEPQKLSLERDMQAALRRNISQLHPSLVIADDGAERSVASGLIDITARDEEDEAFVVIELKAGRADSRAIGQILGYMGDLADEEEDRPVRGILVAHDFDKRVKAAARVVPTLKLMRYAVTFAFEEVA